MATNCTVDLPPTACEGFPNPRAALRTLLTEALDLGLQPENEWPQDASVRVSLYVATDVETRLRRVADDLRLATGKGRCGIGICPRGAAAFEPS